MELPEFDELVHLARTDPEQLEALRYALVERIIEAADERYRRRLRGLQFQIDATRCAASNPLAACIRLSRMMQDSFLVLRDTLETQRDELGRLGEFLLNQANTSQSTEWLLDGPVDSGEDKDPDTRQGLNCRGLTRRVSTRPGPAAVISLDAVRRRRAGAEA